ncbi:MAG: dockerin type I repeat-containing protein [bacterium]|nr:dockerin type I repeat-containing protein [bacterium]
MFNNKNQYFFIGILLIIGSLFFSDYFFVSATNSSQNIIIRVIGYTPTPTPTSPPGGGGGGGGAAAPLPVTQVVFNGRAYPGSNVSLLKDAQLVAKTVADPGANFQISLTGLSAGSYTFSLYGEDNQGRRSNLFTFPITITSGVITQISNIFIAPTIDVDKSEVKRGDNLAIFGQSVPNAVVSIAVHSDYETFVRAKTDKIGAYFYNLDTAFLELGDHLAKSKASLNGELSPFGEAIGFLVGLKNIEKIPISKEIKKVDTNKDGRVNLIDFSIAAYWYKRLNPPQSVDLNGDGKIDLKDFSIMAYYWTG